MTGREKPKYAKRETSEENANQSKSLLEPRCAQSTNQVKIVTNLTISRKPAKSRNISPGLRGNAKVDVAGRLLNRPADHHEKKLAQGATGIFYQTPDSSIIREPYEKSQIHSPTTCDVPPSL